MLPVPYEPGDDVPPYADVGAFEQGSAVSRWALARYLVGRAVGESVSRSLLIVAVLLLGLTAAAAWGLHSTFLAVVVFLMALGVLTLRALMRAVLRRLTATDQVGPVDQRLRALVADTRGDVLQELRRAGLPSHTWTLPLFAIRLGSRRRRGETIERLRSFDIDRVVPRARLDELHLLLRSITGRSGGPVA
ncbi:MAG TPA: hypothetical protein VKQ07_00580 [Jatrophihabitantaceae bacterium]|nr:hypothetical protein [Jatrophihabitantaceae bacterium]